MIRVTFVIVLLVLRSNLAHAGGGEASVVFVNMTPDQFSNEESKACVRTVKKTLGSLVYKTLGESRARVTAQVGKDAPHFRRWTTNQLSRIAIQNRVGGVLFVDCRPSQQLLETLVLPQSRKIMVTKLHAPFSKSLLVAIAGRLKGQAWSGFSP